MSEQKQPEPQSQQPTKSTTPSASDSSQESAASSLAQNFQAVRGLLNQKIVGQEELIDRLLIALLADGHLIVEGVPGLAKTTAIKILAEHVEGDFHRIQFTPDLLPADITGTEIFRPQQGEFKFQEGPIFHHLVLADEINRAPAKVQSALLEAMAERQVSVGSHSFKLPELFLVMATQNPIEQEGTYSLPEAQLDRFLMYVRVDYPPPEKEKAILRLARRVATGEEKQPLLILSQESIFAARKAVNALHMSEGLEEYLVQLILATRNAAAYDKTLGGWIRWGASPRATISLDRCSRARAWLEQRDYVSPEDIQALAHDILRHRIILTFEAEAEGVTTDQVITRLLEQVPVP